MTNLKLITTETFNNLKVIKLYGWDDVFKSVHKSVMIPEPSGYSLKDHMSNVITKKYDRFKMPDPNLPLQRGFPHVFFTRPNCNIFDDAGKGELTEVLTSKDIFKYIK